MYLFFLLNDYTGRRGTGTNKDHNVLVCLAVCCGGGGGKAGNITLIMPISTRKDMIIKADVYV